MLLSACGGGGEDSSGTITVAPASGPGDADAVFPLRIGDTWNYRINETEALNGVTKTATSTAALRVVGTRQLSGSTVTVVRQDNNAEGKQQTINRYYQKVRGGINNWGDNDRFDLLSPKVTPHAELIYPVIPGKRFDKFNNAKLSQDLDGDGAPDRVTVNSSVNVASIGDLRTGAGRFSATRRVEEDQTADVSLTQSGADVSASALSTTWYAPSIGQVKETVVTNLSAPSSVSVATTDAELLGFDVGGVRKGVQPEFNIATPGLRSPCEPAVGHDGKRYLVVFTAERRFQEKLYGVVISEDGKQSKRFGITFNFNRCGADTRYAIAFDGTNYLLVYSRFASLYGIRISPEGEILDSDGGFEISKPTFPLENASPAIAFDGVNYFVVWHRRNSARSHAGIQIIGAFVTPDGVAGDELMIATRPKPGREYPTVSFDGTNYLVAWADQRHPRPGKYYVYAARITQQGLVLEPGGFPVTQTVSYKQSIQSIFDGTNHRVFWWDYIFGERGEFLSKRIAPSGRLIDGPKINKGQKVATRNIAGQHEKLITGRSPPVALELGTNGVVNVDTNSLVVWGHNNDLYGAFIYPSN